LDRLGERFIVFAARDVSERHRQARRAAALAQAAASDSRQLRRDVIGQPDCLVADCGDDKAQAPGGGVQPGPLRERRGW
jgi:hypothetical protein